MSLLKRINRFFKKDKITIYLYDGEVFYNEINKEKIIYAISLLMTMGLDIGMLKLYDLQKCIYIADDVHKHYDYEVED